MKKEIKKTKKKISSDLFNKKSIEEGDFTEENTTNDDSHYPDYPFKETEMPIAKKDKNEMTDDIQN